MASNGRKVLISADHPTDLGHGVISPRSAALTADGAMRISLARAGNVLAAFDGTLDRSRVVNPEVIA